MQLVQLPECGGWDLQWADKLRKSIAKKNPKEYDALTKQFFDNVKELVGIKEKLEHAIHDEIGLRVNVSLVEPKTIDRVESGKAVRVIDKRNE